MRLKDTTAQAEAAAASYTTAALLVNIPTSWNPPGQATFRHQGTSGYWYVIYNKATAGTPTSTLYSFKLAPGERVTEDNPPTGEVWALSSGSGIGVLAYYVGAKS